jgi:outer membrane protein assembly factor BamB
MYLTTDVYFREGALYALGEGTGREAWKQSFGSVPALDPPAVGRGRVYAAVGGHEQTAIWSFDAANGTFLFKAGLSGQWSYPQPGQPAIPAAHTLYVAAGASASDGGLLAFKLT